MKNRILLLIISFLAWVPAMCGQSQASATFTASVTIIEPIGVSTTANMNFASLDAQSGGVVILTPDNNRITQGGIKLAEGGQVSAATFKITGQTGYAYSVSLPESKYSLTNGSDDIIIKDFKSNISSGTIGEEGEVIRVGATLKVNPEQTPGIYTSPGGFNVTVNYN